MLGMIMAFKRATILGIIKSPFVGLDNFRFLFMTDAFRITRNTVLYNLVGIFAGLLLNLVIAISINELRNKSIARVYQTVIILPYFLSLCDRLHCICFLSPVNGFVNFSILPLLGDDKISWYTEPIYWVFILPLVILGILRNGKYNIPGSNNRDR
jgi:putative aldouronate transport system permease protein